MGPVPFLTPLLRTGWLSPCSISPNSSCYPDFYFSFERLKNAGTGHKSLTIIFRYAQILVSARDPGSLVRHIVRVAHNAAPRRTGISQLQKKPAILEWRA